MNDRSGWALAAIIAVSTALGGFVSAAAGSYLLSANTQRETNVQLIQLAIGILSEPLPKDEDSDAPQNEQTALRLWAVETINHSADIKLDDAATRLLVNGQASLPISGGLSDNAVRKWLELRSLGIKSDDPFLIMPNDPDAPAIPNWYAPLEEDKPRQQGTGK